MAGKRGNLFSSQKATKSTFFEPKPIKAVNAYA